jgi:DDE superfamily endonuclease
MVLGEYLAPGQRLRYFCQDETRFGLKTLTGKVITSRGVKPIAPVQWGRDNFWLYGAVEPLTGDHFYQDFAHLNHQHFQTFIDQFSQSLGADYAILQVDQAGAHMTDKLRWPENIIPLPQPPHSPELNPIERVWQAIKRHLKGRIFTSLDDLKVMLQAVLDDMTTAETMSLSGYDFILEALFYVASH